MAPSTAETTLTASSDVELPDAKILKRLKLSPEVAWYLVSRGYELPPHPPLYKTPEGNADPEARFDPDAVDKVIRSMRLLRHTQGRWAGQPLEPDAWQVAYVLAPVFGWLKPGVGDRWVRVARTCIIDIPRKNGKGIDLDEAILTGGGWRRFGDLRVGDRVHSIDGSLTEVSFVSEVHSGLRCFEVTFSDGRSVVCDEQHLWAVWDRYGHDPVEWREHRQKGAWRTIDTPTLLREHRAGARGDARFSVHTDRVIMRPAASLPVDPYVLGYWLGDGDSAAARFTVGAGDLDEFLTAARLAGYSPREPRFYRGPSTARVTVSGLVEQLRELGVIGNKHVPDLYLTASEEQRLELLRGLMDSDGSISKRCEFTATSRELAESVLFLARSLGWKATLKVGRATINGVDCGAKYRVTWTATNDRSPFRLARKTAQLPASPKGRTRSSTATIVSVREVESRPTRCIQVEHPSRQFLVGRGLIPTHNTTLAGGIALYLTGADGEAGAQVIAAATSLSQAQFVFNPVKLLAQKSPALRGHFRPLSSKITHPKSGSVFQAVGRVADAQHGSSPHGAVIDELHVHKDRDLVDAIESGTGAREQPLILILTTPDDGKPHTIYASKRRQIEQLTRGTIKDPSVYGVVFGLPDHANPLNPDNWPKANPGYPISPSHDFLKNAAAKARTSPVELALFKRLHAGQRTRQTTAYLDLKKWDHNKSPTRGKPWRVEQFEGWQAFGGLDLASVSDLTALCWLLPDEDAYRALWRFWVPEDAVENLDKSTAGNASGWVTQGWLHTTPGNVTDYDWIKKQVLDDSEVLDVESIGLDMWNASQLANDLTDEGLPLMKVRQGFYTMNPAMQEIKRRVLQRELRHDGNPVMRWCVDNLAVSTDPAGNVKPDKARSADKIDGVSALANAMSEAIANHRGPSAYDHDHGLQVVG